MESLPDTSYSPRYSTPYSLQYVVRCQKSCPPGSATLWHSSGYYSSLR